MGRWRADQTPRGRVSPLRAARLALLIVPLLLSGLPFGLFTLASSTGNSAAVADSNPSPHGLPNETVTVRNQTIGDLSNFWGVGVNHGYGLSNATNETQGTPIDWFVWPAGAVADSYDMQNGTLWTDGTPSHAAVNESQFVAECRAISCHAIFSVPGEIDSPSTAAYEVVYTEQVLGFHPAYWEIGNEPYRWLHFGIGWSRWNSTDDSHVTPTGYAQVVQAYITAMRSVDSSLQFIGLPGVGAGSRPDGPWINATVALNGPNLSAIGIHDYPGESGPLNGTLARFFATLTNTKTYMVTRLTTDEKEIKAEEGSIGCGNCAIKLFVDEFGAGTGSTGSWQPFMQTYPEVPYVTAELLMMSESNVSNADIFELRSTYNGSLFTAAGLPLPLDSLYTQILPHYGLTPLNTTLTGTQKGVFAGVSETPKSNSLTLLAVNTNTTQAVQLSISGGVFPSDGSYSVWRGNNSSTSPEGTFSQSFGYQSAPSWVLPPLGVILVSACRSNASLALGGSYPLTFCESALPSGTPWSVTVGSSTIGSTTGTISFSEPNGTYSYQVGPIPGWRTPNLSGSVAVNEAPASILVPWTVVPYPVTFTENGLPPGTVWSVTLGGTLYRSNATSITAFEPNGTYGYILGIVAGWTTAESRGLVVVNVTPVQVVVNWTQVTYVVTFHESGLPPMTNWSIDLAGTTENATSAPIRFAEPNGSYAYTVGSVAGFIPDATSGSVTVNGATQYVPLTWAQNVSVYSIQFNETGLPPGTAWSVNLNGTVQSGTTTTFTFHEPNGIYPYSLGGVAGWAPSVYQGNVSVSGATVFVNTPYTRVTYGVTFTQTGLPYPWPGGNWSIVLNGTAQTQAANDSTLQFVEPNGTYLYRVGGEPGYTTNQSQGSVTVNGSSSRVAVVWSPYFSPVTFVESGLPSGANWTLYVTGTDPVVSYVVNLPPTESFTNGTYTYSVTTNVAGMGISPPVGTFTVSGHPVSVSVSFLNVYPVTFIESGLPSTTNWSVNLNGFAMRVNGSSIQFLVPNGTFSFNVPPLPNWVASPAQGSGSVNGAPVNESILFGAKTWPVTFTETGLPTGTYWSVSLPMTTNQGMNWSTGNTVSFAVPNGSSSYVIPETSGYRPLNSNGTFAVRGTAVTFAVTFIQFEPTYPVTFNETGLPTGTNWWVTLNRSVSFSNGTSVVIYEPNGSYSFDIVPLGTHLPSPSSGMVNVTGTPYPVAITWTNGYWVNFTETGLPNGTAWSVVLNGITNASPSQTISFLELNGTYSYQIGAVSGWSPTLENGTVRVEGSGVSVSVAWTTVTFPVSFTEVGLPTGTNWSVSLNGGLPVTSSSGTITVWEPQGVYTYQLGIVPGWNPRNISGTITVPSPIAVTVHFAQYLYKVTIVEVGLPAGSAWSVTLNGQIRNGTSAGLFFKEPNGTYPFSVRVPPGFFPGEATGSVQVLGAPARVAITVTGTGGGSGWTLSVLNSEVVVALVAVGATFALVGVTWVSRRKRGVPPPTP